MSSDVVNEVTNSGSPPKKIYFVISARDLPKRERSVLGATVQDPYIKWSHKKKQSKIFTVGGATTHRNNDPNPDWSDNVFSFKWDEGSGQVWRFTVWDHDLLSKDEPIDSVEVDVDSYVVDTIKEHSAKLPCGGTLIIKPCRPIHFRLAAMGLPKLDAFNGLSDPYVKCYWSFGEGGRQTLFATTKTIKNVENVIWEESITFSNYQKDTDQHWTFKVFDKDPLPRDDRIGEVSVNLDAFVIDNYVKNTAAIFKLSKDAKNDATLIIKPVVT